MCLPGDAIHGFEEVVLTANKMLKIAKVYTVSFIFHGLKFAYTCHKPFVQILGCEVVVTEQNPKGNCITFSLEGY
jgi:hypothetical protein